MKTILITGGSGLIGKYLGKLLKAKGYHLHVLSRGADEIPGFDKTFVWDVDAGTMDEKALEGVTHIVHLSGAGIADSVWTDARKKLIIDSRVKSLELIHRTLKTHNKKIEVLVSGSAIGWYGAITDEKLHVETEANATDFMGKTCSVWENAASAFEDVATRIVKIRTGVVLAKEGGALPQMMKPFKFYVGSVLGSGKQQIPWIHISDIAAIFAVAIDNEAYSGPINATATEECSNEAFSKTLASVMHKPLIPFAVPSIFLKLALGDMSKVVLEGSRVSNQKLLGLNYKLEFDNLEAGLKDLLA